MARKRAYKKRADYRKGGRVNLEGGGIPFDDPNYVLGGTATTGGAGFGQGASTGAVQKPITPVQKPVTPAYTQSDVDQAVADLNAGKITAADLAAQYGVSVDYVNQNLAAINAQNAAAASTTTTPAQTAPATTDTATTDTATTDTATTDTPTTAPASDSTLVPELPRTIPSGPSAADIADIPADGDYSAFETQQVVQALNAGTITSADAAKKFGVTVAQVEQELARQNQVADPTGTGTTDILDPFATGLPSPARKEAITDIAKGTGFKGKPVTLDVKGLQDQILALDNQLLARGLVKGTPEYTAAQEQARAEFVRLAQESGQVNFTLEEFAAAVGLSPDEASRQYYNYNFSGKDDLGLTYNDKITKAKDDVYVPGSYLKNYKPVDINTLTQKQKAEKIGQEGTITADEAIKKLGTFDGITEIDPATSTAISNTVAKVTQALNEGTVNPNTYEEVLAGELEATVPAFAGMPAKAIMDEIRALTQPAEAAQITDAEAISRKAAGVDYIIDDKSFVPEVTGTTATISDSPQAEAASRAAITGTQATAEEAKIIDQVGYTARQRATVTGEAAKGAAADVIAQTAEIPNAIAASVVEDPAAVAAVVDTQPIEVQAAIAALPTEALVSAQMENLLGGMESGNIPAWARPAVSAVEQGLAARGLGVSTVGRDALFNAVIQSALPMAQSNAQALQTNAAQNLTNQQQANLEEARLNSTRRLTNLANQQTAASQTAQFAQNLKVLQSQQGQEAAMLSAQQQQQIRVQNLQNRQRSAELTAQNQQQINSQELGNEQQIELAELEIKNQAEQQNMTATNQERLAEMQIAAEFLAKNADFKQQMNLANLNTDQQMRLANLTAMNQADAESLSNEQQTELTNLNAKMQTNITNANIAAEMNVAQLNVDQQRAVTNATTQARIDLTKFTTAQQVELANSQFMQSTTLTNMNARQQAAIQNATAMASLDLSTADSRTKLAVENARNFLQVDISNLNNRQQAIILDTQMDQQRLLSDQAASNAARQFGATSENQVEMFLKSQADAMTQFNATQLNAMSQFNKAEENRLAAIDEQNAVDVSKFNAQIELQVEQFNENIENQRDVWNASNAQAIEQANTNWRRQANTADTAAINAANAQNVQNAFGISTQELDFIWNSLKDEATFLRKEALDLANQKTNMYITAMNNESNTAINNTGVADGVKNLIDEIFS